MIGLNIGQPILKPKYPTDIVKKKKGFQYSNNERVRGAVATMQ